MLVCCTDEGSRNLALHRATYQSDAIDYNWHIVDSTCSYFPVSRNSMKPGTERS